MNEKRKKRIMKPSNTVTETTNSLVNEGRGDILSDVLGSYTGTAADGETPEQDADDL